MLTTFEQFSIEERVRKEPRKLQERIKKYLGNYIEKGGGQIQEIAIEESENSEKIVRKNSGKGQEKVTEVHGKSEKNSGKSQEIFRTKSGESQAKVNRVSKDTGKNQEKVKK